MSEFDTLYRSLGWQSDRFLQSKWPGAHSNAICSLVFEPKGSY